MITLLRTSNIDPDFTTLVRLLDDELALTEGEEHAFYAKYDSIENIRYAVLAYCGKEPVGCGAIKNYAPGVMEIKRMFTLPSHRGKGIAAQVLAELEKWAQEITCFYLILETGKNNARAITLYRKNGYELIDNYAQYAGVASSVCFKKALVAEGQKYPVNNNPTL